MGEHNSLNIEKNLFRICNKEYIFNIYVYDDNNFLFDWNPELDELDAALLLYYASINLSQ